MKSKLIIKTVTVGMVRTNCYIVFYDNHSECIIVDPGDQADLIIDILKNHSLDLKAIFLTHGHFDHILAVNDLVREYSVPVYAGEKEIELLEDMDLNCSVRFREPCTVKNCMPLHQGEELDVAGISIRVIETPGHTQGGVCYYLPKNDVLFSGDTLFQSSIGRTDLPTGSQSTLVHSIREQLMILPDDVMVYPGHEDSTSIMDEKKNNPFI